MGIVRKQSFTNSIVLYTGTILGFVNIVYLFQNYFPVEEFGLVRILLSSSTILSILMNFGLPAITLKYFPYFKDEEKGHHGFLFFAHIVTLLSLLLLLLVVFFLKEPIISIFYKNAKLFVEKYNWVFLLTAFQISFEIYASYSISILRSEVPLFIREIVIRVLVFISILLYINKIVDFDQFLFCYTLSYGIPVLIAILYLRHINQLFLKPDLSKLNRPFLKEIFVYGLFALLNRSASNLNNRVDQIMLSAMVGLSSVGIYTVGFFISELIFLPTKAMNQITNPLTARAFAQNDVEQVKSIYKKTSINQLILGSLVLLLIWMNIDELLALMKPIYFEARYVVLYIGLSKIIQVGTGNNDQIIVNSKYFRYNFYFLASLLILTVITNAIFIPIYGLIGAAFATTLSITINNATKTIFVWLKLKLHPFGWNTLKAILGALMTYFVAIFIPSISVSGIKIINAIFQMALNSIIILIVFSSLILLLKPSEDINDIFKKLVKRYLKI